MTFCEIKFRNSHSGPQTSKNIQNVVFFYSLKVKTLKQIAEDRGLQGFKKLRKPALVELLSK